MDADKKEDQPRRREGTKAILGNARAAQKHWNFAKVRAAERRCCSNAATGFEKDLCFHASVILCLLFKASPLSLRIADDAVHVATETQRHREHFGNTRWLLVPVPG